MRLTPPSGLGSPRKKQSGPPYKFAHTAGSSKGLGDYYGTGIVAKLGKMREGSTGMQTLTPEELKKPPKSVG
jgi:hypothetical protein